jgi:hypothetical protein
MVLYGTECMGRRMAASFESRLELKSDSLDITPFTLSFSSQCTVPGADHVITSKLRVNW